MSSVVYTQINNLPTSLVEFLHHVNYGKKDIPVKPGETVNVGNCGGDGRRAFFAIVKLDDSEPFDLQYGSWGGANMFETRRSDVDFANHPIMPGYAVVVGSEGSTGVFATVYIHPSNVAAVLPIQVETTERQKYILKCYKSLTSAGRKNEWERYSAYGSPVGGRPSNAEITELVNRGFLNRNKAGAVSITTAGKNAS
jgi:hypothetical protein